MNPNGDKKPFKAMLGVFIIVFVGVGILIADFYKAHYMQNELANNQNQAVEMIPTLGLTPTDYGKRFNEIVTVDALKSDQWQRVQAQTPPNSEFVIHHGNGLILVGHTNREGALDRLEYTEPAVKTAAQGNVPLVRLTTTVAQTLAPKSSIRGINRRIKGLLNAVALNYAQTKQPEQKTITLDTITYTFKMSDAGFVFIAAPTPADLS